MPTRSRASRPHAHITPQAQRKSKPKKPHAALRLRFLVCDFSLVCDSLACDLGGGGRTWERMRRAACLRPATSLSCSHRAAELLPRALHSRRIG
eukprot:3438364-Rhodomonas_salina.1